MSILKKTHYNINVNLTQGIIRLIINYEIIENFEITQ